MVFTRKYLNTFILCFFLSCHVLFAQNNSGELGYYNIRNYTVKEYNEAAQNWAVVQDKRGLIYIGNNFGVLVYNGVRWKSCYVGDNIPIRSLAVDTANRIYVGSIGEIGYMDIDNKGEYSYVSLNELIPEHHRTFEEVWKTFIDTQNNIYFFTKNCIYKWDGTKFDCIDLGKPMQTMFYYKNEFYVSVIGDGLVKLVNDKPQNLNLEELLEDRVYAMLPFKTDKTLILTRKQGLFILEKSGNNYSLVKFKTEADFVLFENPVYNGLQVTKNTYSLGTLGGGIVIIDDEGRYIKSLSKSEGLQDATIYAQFMDAHSNLWLALSNGLSRVEINAPITSFNEAANLSGSVKSIIRANGKLFAATNVGVFYMEAGGTNTKNNNFSHAKFQRIPDFPEECWDLLSFGKPGKQDVLIAGTSGLYQYHSDMKLEKLFSWTSNVLIKSKKDSNRIFVGCQDALYSIYYNGVRFTEEFKFPNAEFEVESIYEDPSGNIWVGTIGQGLKKIIPNYQGNKIVNSSLLQTSLHELSVKRIEMFNDKLLFGTDSGLYSIKSNAAQLTLNTENDFGDLFSSNKNGIHRIVASKNQLWNVVSINGQGLQISYVKIDSKGNKEIISHPFKIVSKETTYDIYPEEHGVTWIGGTFGLLRFDEKSNNDNHRKFHSLINYVVAGKDTVFKGNYKTEEGRFSITQTENFKPIFEYRQNSIEFTFSALNFEYETENLYSSQLFGWKDDESWSDYKTNTQRNFTNLPEGTYTFKVRSKNVYGFVSEIAEYEFTILPPWYRTWWAYTIYILGFVGFVYGAITYTTRGLRSIIKKQTAEVVAQKEEIEKKSQDITDSIHYAKRIQHAILPNLETINKSLPNSFVLFKPRDVVSGDFYWFAQVEKNGKSLALIAAADCTGHGVPGAFMSMIGNTILHEIVITNNITSPSKILSELHLGVRTALKQSENESRDGMDIALLCIEVDTGITTYAGANRPLWIVKNEDLAEIKATKAAIGGFTDEAQVFAEHSFEFKKGDSIYMSTDGYADQFGGEEGKKFMTKKFKEVVINAQKMNMIAQQSYLDETIENWRGHNEQVDDILVIGVRF